MNPVKFHARITDGSTAEMVGFPTAVPGLVVNHPYEPCENHSRCWVVSHYRSGGRLPFCWDSPEPAGEFASRIADFTDWSLPFKEAQRTLLPRAREVADVALGLGAEWNETRPNGRLQPMDNGGVR